MNIRPARSAAVLLSIISLGVVGCDSVQTTQPATTAQPALAAPHSGTGDVISQTYTSGTQVMTWDAIAETNQPSNFAAAYCTATPQVGINANWQNPHNAFVVYHPWAGTILGAPWINAWNGNGSEVGNPIAPHYNWTKYETQVAGNGTFQISLVADNCSWIYLDGTLVGVQGDTGPHAQTYGLTLNGTHTLTFIIFDGGGASGGQYKLETTSNPPPPLNNDLDNDGHVNTEDAFPLNPAEWADTDGDGYGDNSDAFPTNAAEHLDTDHDGVGDNADAYPNDPTRSSLDADADGIVDTGDNCPAVANASQADLDHDGIGDACDPDIDGDGVVNASDAFPTNPAESVDSDGDGVGNNSDAFPNNPAESVDTDHDGVGNNGDNCRFVANTNQADLDHDGIGDACDSDIDGDGIANSADAFPTNPAEWADSDGDGVGNNADAFDNSNTGPALVVGTCNTGVANWYIGGGTWANDVIAEAYASSANHGKFVQTVTDISNGWKKAGIISGAQHGAITSCAARMK